MHTRLTIVATLLCMLAAARAEAQFRARAASPEDFNVELGYMFFTPTPELTLTTGDVRVGTVDFVQEFGIEKETFREFRAVVKAARKHKIRYARLPIEYDQSAVLQRTITFQNVSFPVTASATANIKWDIHRIGYEWDFVRQTYGFVGLVTELKYSTVKATVSASGVVNGQTQSLSEAVDQKAPAPTIGGIARGYLGKHASITGEFTGLKIDRSDFLAKFYDFDVYGAAHLGRNVGVQVGYRSITVDFLVDNDQGTMKMKGRYLGGFVRF
jgi:hypothetical protein